ncbi:MAG: sugar-transfer associated ATP-grasp domain-containing protein [Balneolaceae bacterium]
MVKKILLKLLTPYAWLRNKRRYKRKVNRIKRNLSLKKDQKYINSSISYYKQFGIKLNPLWHILYANANGKQKQKYIPEDIFYFKIEPILNNEEYYWTYSNKMLFHRVLNVSSLDLIYKLKGNLYDSDFNIMHHNLFNELSGPFIAKKMIDSQGGKGIKKIETPGNLLNYLNSHDNIIIQRYLQQHPFFQKLNETSLNTIRVISLSMNNKINVLSAVLRMGRTGSIVDNLSSGGLTIGIDKSGYTRNFLFDKNFQRYEHTHPDSNVTISSKKIPGFKAMMELTKELHKKVPFIGLVSWDMAIDSEGNIIVLEMNIKEQGINLHQLNNGELFGSRTDEVLRECFN